MFLVKELCKAVRTARHTADQLKTRLVRNDGAEAVVKSNEHRPTMVNSDFLTTLLLLFSSRFRFVSIPSWLFFLIILFDKQHRLSSKIVAPDFSKIDSD